jgi:O-antigen/teichoic acid export membrane protein
LNGGAENGSNGRIHKMSRLKKFTHSLVSGYVSVGANIFYTLASVPLALHYLGKPEFGLWALVAQISGYIALIDFGMANSVSRFLIDHKDDRRDGAYGSVIKTSVLVGLVQGGLIILAGGVLALLAGSALHVPDDLQRKFAWLVIGQSLLTGLSFATRVFNYLLIAHQRLDIPNYGYTLTFFLSLAGMWAGMAAGWGVYGFLAGQAVSTLGNVVINGLGCMRLNLFPGRGEWGGVTWVRFRELFAYGRDNFLIGVGWQFISASQTILLTRFLGLETAAVWSVCTRSFGVVTMLVWRIFDFSTPALAEMMVRGERDRLLRRFQDITVFSASLSVVGAVLLAVCNSPFVWFWTSGKIHWSPVNDLLLGVSCFLATAVRPHTTLAVQTKLFGFLRFIFLVEGLAFVGLNLLAYRLAGMTTLLVLSILCTLSFTLPYGLHRTRQYFGLNWRELARWFEPVLRLSFWVVPVGGLAWWLTQDGSAILQLAVRGGIFGIWTAWAFLRHGLPASLQMEIHHRAPGWSKPFFGWIGFARSQT